MISAFRDLTTYDGDEWEEYLDNRCLLEIFQELIKKYKDSNIPGLLKCIIRYIVWTYSKDSTKVVISDSWLKNKERIYEAADLPPIDDIRNEVMYCREEAVLVTIKRWLEFQDNDTFKEIAMLKDLRLEMQISANGVIRNAQGEMNYDQKFKNAKYSLELGDMLKEAESKLIQNDQKLKEGMSEIKRATKSSFTVGPETFSK